MNPAHILLFVLESCCIISQCKKYKIQIVNYVRVHTFFMFLTIVNLSYAEESKNQPLKNLQEATETNFKYVEVSYKDFQMLC